MTTSHVTCRSFSFYYEVILLDVHTTAYKLEQSIVNPISLSALSSRVFSLLVVWFLFFIECTYSRVYAAVSALYVRQAFLKVILDRIGNQSPLTSNRHHMSYDDCLENKGRLQDCSCSHIMSSSYRSNRFVFVSLGSLHCA